MGLFSSLFSSKSKESVSTVGVGDFVSSFSAQNEEGQTIEVNMSTGYTLVYFYPKADTPGCTAQACSLRDAYSELVEKNMIIYGVSTDGPKAQKAFKEKYQIPFSLLCDEDKTIAERFGVPVRMGFSSRQAFLIKDGKLVWVDRSASTQKQAQDVLDFLSSQ